ncbi:MAG TPA: hypothetical protein DCS19_02695 [Flavobacterium sp.]|nr:hypothetical protein [Flavobacterium sp.]
MFQKLIFEVVLSFLIRQIIKYGDSIDFAIIREDVRELVRKIVPGNIFDETAVQFVDTMIDGIVYLFENLEITGVLEAIKNKDLNLALSILRDLLKRYLGVV